MRQITETTIFRRDIKRAKKRGKKMEKLRDVVLELTERGSLPSRLKPHPLTGEWRPAWECHIEPDWLLVYEITPTEVKLVRMGTHADLFD